MWWIARCWDVVQRATVLDTSIQPVSMLRLRRGEYVSKEMRNASRGSRTLSDTGLGLTSATLSIT